MPTITRTMIKTALVYVLIGMVLSTLWLVHFARPFHPLISHLQPTAFHVIVVGWLTQLIFGIALWMFPIWSRQQPRGPAALGWLCYGLLNAGLVLRLLAEPINSYQPAALWGWMLVVSAVLQVAAISLFIVLVWRRVRAKASVR